MRKKQVILMALLCAVITAPANAAPYALRGTWYVDFSGIPFAKLWIAVEETPQQYELTAAFKSTGLVRLFKEMRSLTLSHGVRTDAGMQARLFHYTNNTEDKETLLRFDAAGRITERRVVPEDDPEHRPPVDAQAVGPAHTPGDILFAVRERARALPKESGASFTLRLYDGKRLMDVSAEYIDASPVVLKEVSVPAYRFKLSRVPVAGFTQKELNRYQDGEPPVMLSLRQGDYFPVHMAALLPLGTLQARWEAEP